MKGEFNNMPNLTEKGQFAFNIALQHFKTQKFSAADLTAISGEKVSAASLNAIVNKGYMLKEAGSPVKFYFVDNIDMLLELEKNTSIEEVNKVFRDNVNETLHYTDDPIVSSDIISSDCGATVDSRLTDVIEVDGKQLVKVVAWYDNEMGYSAQMVRTAKKLV